MATYPDLPFTKFPEEVDSFTSFIDIIASDGPMIKSYTNAMNNGDTELANKILRQIPAVSQKIVKASDLNKLSQAMLAMERFYKTDIEPYVEVKESRWLTVVDQFSYKGVWNERLYYKQNNMVSLSEADSNYLYIAIKPAPVGVAPTNTEYWRPLTIKGETGQSGRGFTYRQNWNVGTSYSAYDAVTYGGVLWVALVPSKGVYPDKSSSWNPIMSLSATTYPIQSTEPVGQPNGSLWFDTSGDDVKYVALAPLVNPATASDIARGKRAYDDKGNVITGTSTGGRSEVEWNGVSDLTWN